MSQNEPDLTALPINGNAYVNDYEYESMAYVLLFNTKTSFSIFFTLTYDITASF